MVDCAFSLEFVWFQQAFKYLDFYLILLLPSKVHLNVDIRLCVPEEGIPYTSS